MFIYATAVCRYVPPAAEPGAEPEAGSAAGSAAELAMRLVAASRHLAKLVAAYRH